MSKTKPARAMAKSKSKPAKGGSVKQARRPPPRAGELEDAALDQVAGGGRTSAAAASDMSQQMQFDLQDAAQEQQDAMQTLSNMSKSMHDTAKAMIKNMKA